ncbi:hypothetical protein D5400_20295 [Georhizobium profundi]|jgi:transposase|uniref:Transposase n=1 Tax=Georhizobium profundi TaxID=2341112 RepID=A0A3Q8XTJ6_9HYPH|nr:hypothetical protein D5400_20295 [Georhizobium profundi]
MMVTGNYSDKFKRDAVAQITERGCPVSEVSQRLSVSQHSLYVWKKKFSQPSGGDGDQAAGIRRLKKELARVTEERDILKNRWRAAASLCAVETPVTRARGGELPMAYWRHTTPLKKRGTWADPFLRTVTPRRW